jgi:outer membrane protein OmpA-like peptidoglycan-associated protein
VTLRPWGEGAPLLVGLAAGLAGVALALVTAHQIESALAQPRARPAVSTPESPPASEPVPVPVAVDVPENAPPPVPEPPAELDPETKPEPPPCPPEQIVGFGLGRARPGDPVSAAPFETWLDRYPDAVLVIDGHADPYGSTARNLQLSRQRARAVARRLRADGVPNERLRVRAFGDYSPRLDGTRASDQRRVHVHLVGVPGCEEMTR